MIPTITLDWRFGTIAVPAADRYIRRAIELTGEYSGAEIDLYQALLEPGDVAVDVGANVGVFSIAMGLSVGSTGRVLSFEPQPPIFELLKLNLAAAGLTNAEVHRAVVAEAAGSVAFADVRSLPAGKEVNFGAVGLHTRIADTFGTMVATPVMTLDALGLVRCDFLKIDAEGSEHAVLAGARRALERSRPLLCVECDRPDTAGALVDPLLQAGYRLWRFRGANMRTPNPKGASLDGHGRISVLMLLAVPVERLARMDRVDTSPLQPVDSRAGFERLSTGIVKDRL